MNRIGSVKLSSKRGSNVHLPIVFHIMFTWSKFKRPAACKCIRLCHLSSDQTSGTFHLHETCCAKPQTRVAQKIDVSICTKNTQNNHYASQKNLFHDKVT